MSRVNINGINAMIEKLQAKKEEALATIDARIEKAKVRCQKADDALKVLEEQKASLTATPAQAMNAHKNNESMTTQKVPADEVQ